ncbi:MAG TPA: potassium transporter Kup [Caldilineaceae bacterium]|nr:potassium transporter Kup [Caldilineaceae bacterium]
MSKSAKTEEQVDTEHDEHGEHGEHNGHGATAPQGKYLLYLTLGALGVVYGDIGTSPLYAFRESFHTEYGLAVVPENILGILSLIFWALVLIISIKYITFVMRADNRGEGGILALTALINPHRNVQRGTTRYRLILLGLFGTALLYGDGMITPAISVLSAVEGLEVATPFFQPYIIPITIAILILLFLFQSRGTASVGKVFGPMTLIWFMVLALLGLRWIVREPGVLAAVSPHYAFFFFLDNGLAGFLVLGSVFLVVTGGEALYADMGHFGKRPIRVAWFTIVLPALLLNYFGQGALLLQYPEAVENPFYRMAPTWALYPVVLIATTATVIASQALITGAFSLTRQAVQLGYLPRMAINHTSEEEIGQIYIPGVNWLLMVACIALVFAFGSSSNLAAAYGVAVTTTMVITALILYVVEREHWQWSRPKAVAFTAFFLLIDFAFWGANIVKIPAGGWFPLVIGAVVFTLMTTWKRGREILWQRLRAGTMPFATFTERLRTDKYAHVPGTAVFMYSDPNGTPPALLHNIKHNKVLHEQVILLSVEMEEIPRVARQDRVTVHHLENDFHRVILRYGFLEDPNVPRDLVRVRRHGLYLKHSEVSYFLGRERLLTGIHPEMPIWRENLFAVMSRNARNATDFFRLPPDRVVELGAQVEL